MNKYLVGGFKSMLKLCKVLFLGLTVTIFSTSCSNNSNNKTPEVSSTVSYSTPQIDSTADPKESTVSTIADSFETFFRGDRFVRLQKSGEETVYEGSDTLSYAINDMFHKLIPVDMEKDLKMKNFDYDKYDYRLKFNGSLDILFSMETNTVHFEDKKEVYRFWGTSDDFWKSLKYDKEKKSVDVDENKLDTQKYTIKDDIDGDQKADEISLIYRKVNTTEVKGDIILKINNVETEVYKGVAWQVYPSLTISKAPAINIISGNDAKNKVVAITTTIETSEGSRADVLAFSYNKTSIEYVSIKEPDVSFTYEGKGIVKAYFPQIGSNVNVEFDEEAYKPFLGNDNTFKSVFEDKNRFSNNPLAFSVKDYNGDGKTEIACISSLKFEGALGMSMGTLYTFYTSGDTNLKPIKAIIAPPYNENKKVNQVIGNVYDALINYGNLVMGKEGINDPNLKLFEEVNKEQENKVVNELISSKYLKVENGKLYINY